MTFFLETLRLGLANLLLHKLRSLLTALGIIIGVAAVVAIAAYGEGSKRAALAGIRELGANNILLRSVKPPESDALPQQEAGEGGGGDEGTQLLVSAYGISRLDLRRLEQPSVGPIQRIVPLKQVGTFVYRGPAVVQAARVYGTTPQLFEALPMKIARGRTLDATDAGRFTAVIGADAAGHLFRLDDPLGNTFSIDGQPFTVIGILEPIGVTAGRSVNFDIFIPLDSAEGRFGDLRVLPGGQTAEDVELSELIIRVGETDLVKPVAEQIRRVLEAGHGDRQDVQVTVPLELIEQESRTQLMFTVLMVVIALLSLLVGGIGIMNIMLASVTERTREIGVRRALGATRRHIVFQFLVETTVLSLVGGLLGVLLGLGVSVLLGVLGRYVDGVSTPVPTPWSIALGFTAATLVGVIAGLYPAVRAAWSDPIVALRHD